MVISRRRRGACSALRWNDEPPRYVCGAIIQPASVLPTALRWLAPLLARMARRWVAAGQGCDADWVDA